MDAADINVTEVADGGDAERRRALTRFRLVGVLIPLMLTAAVVVAQLALLPRLPNRVATHWGFSGTPDGWGAPWAYPVATGAICGALIALISLLALAGRSRRGALDLRMISAINLWTVGFFGVLMLLLVIVQLDLEDAGSVPLPWWGMAAAFAIGVVLGVVGWQLTPRVAAEAADGVRPDPIALRPGEQAAWLQTVTMARPGVIVLVVSQVALVLMAVYLFVIGEVAAGWAIAGTGVLIALLVLMMTAFRVRFDAAGFQARSLVGWPRVQIPIDEIASVEVVEINPMGDFGGWGWRFNSTYGQGIVMRAGEALLVTRTNGKRITVTVDDATTAAGLLRGYQQSDRG
ncbi:DUF1648 domain-containing protein [Parenemella sanctibonifatiensis]|uniref:DUF1648 domain-containing protein n=1 Tax=Parenemella sanctibonifatiensis TaxID=2016505 RepID=A0A255E8R2_9ACTN|nr:DUF1648 domain-containing protein [Parenemella sanctibonifatiensis]OYN87957.1 hypothetical protein CGZ92_06785 [Parenemella sanctibonifatiensis]